MKKDFKLLIILILFYILCAPNKSYAEQNKINISVSPLMILDDYYWVNIGSGMYIYHFNTEYSKHITDHINLNSK